MLVTLKEQIQNPKQIKQISIISFIIMLILTALINEIQENTNIEETEMPMLTIAQKISPIAFTTYGIMTGIAIFTSAISAGYSLINNTKKQKSKALILCLIAIPISTISFSYLVNLMYPIFGILGTIQIIFILKTWKKH